jgi:hypothetical protein
VSIDSKSANQQNVLIRSVSQSAGADNYQQISKHQQLISNLSAIISTLSAPC